MRAELCIVGSIFLAAIGAFVVFAIDAPVAHAARSTINPVPCTPQPWQYDDPSFAALPAAKSFSGRYPGGTYRIEVPSQWNGELVLYSHGFIDSRGAQGSLVRVSNPPIRQHLIDQGFAWAASSYRCNGYVPGIALEDTIALIDQFAALRLPSPRRVYLAGTSMGGHVDLLAMHMFPTGFAGALAMCSSGPELFDYFAAVVAAAEAVTGVDLARGDPRSNFDRLVRALGKPPNYTDKGRQLASVQIEISGGARPFAMEGLGARFVENLAILPQTGGLSLLEQAATNKHIDYRIDSALGLSADALNAKVKRKASGLRLRTSSDMYPDLVPFSGRIQGPVVTMHGSGDLFVPIHLEQSLYQAVASARRQQWLVQRVYRAPGHCTFNLAEQSRSFDDLVKWVRTGVKPAGDDVNDLMNAGRQFTRPLRANDPGTVRVVPAN